MHSTGTEIVPDEIGEIGVADRRRGACIPGPGGAGEHRAPAGKLFGFALAEGLRKPAFENTVGERLDALGARGLDALVPHGAHADLVSGVAQDRRQRAARRTLQHALADQPADAHPDQDDPVDRQVVEQAEQILHVVVHRIGVGPGIGQPVPRLS